MNTICSSFMKIYNLTLKCLPKGQDLKDINPATMWSDLADLWQTNESDMGFSVFEAVWHLIFWGTYPENVESDTAMQLVAAVRDESLVIGEAMLAWDDRDDYADAWDTITSSTRSQLTRGPSIHMDIHNRFLQKRAYLKEYRDLYECQTKSSSPNINFIKEYTEKATWCADYQEIVVALIPKAKKWSYADWGDDRKILRQLSGNGSYRSFFLQDTINSRLAFLMRVKKGGGLDCLFEVVYDIEHVNINQLSAVLWPDKNKHQIEKLLLAAYEEARKVELRYQKREPPKRKLNVRFTYDTLCHSWLLPAVEHLYYSGLTDPANKKRLEKALFDLRIRGSALSPSQYRVVPRV